jgi:hypothetical protein
MQKENPMISFARLDVSYFQSTKWYCTKKPTISDDQRMQKGEYDIFCMLGCIVFSSHCRMDAFLYNTASKGTSSINSKERVVMYLDILLVNDRP